MGAVKLEEWIRSEIERRKLWAFLEQMGSEGGRYHTGYLQALMDVQGLLVAAGKRDDLLSPDTGPGSVVPDHRRPQVPGSVKEVIL